MRVRAETVDGGIEQSIILAEDGTVRREEEFDVGCADSLEAPDEVGQIRPVVGVDDTHAPIPEDVVAGKQEVAHPHRELAGRMTRRTPDLQLLISDPDPVPFIDRAMRA
jgi:hypothetical protein